MNARRPRIAVLADWWWPETVGGAERSARSAALDLARSADVAVFVPAAVEKTYADGPLTIHAVRRPFARRAHADTAARRGVEFLTAWLLPLVARRLTRRIASFQPDIVVAGNVSRMGPWSVRWVRSKRLPFVRIYHDLSDTCWRRSRLKGTQTCATICGSCAVKTRLMRSATPAATTAVCVSGFVRRELTDAGLTTPETSVVGYPLVAAEPSAPTVYRPTGHDFVFGYIGRIAPVKGIEAAIRVAAAYRRATGKTVLMLVAGEGAADYLQDLAAVAGAEAVEVEFAGHMDVDAFCSRVDAVFVPSMWMEAFGRVVVEVGSRGRPMLISPVGGLPEAAAVSGGRYAFADYQRPEAAAGTLAGLLDGRADDGVPLASAMTLNEGVVLAVERALAALASGKRA
ncbi:glycosyltransferase [Micromonospora sp. CPCC 205371]|nr:glycosyltransferase [Micromonospora sp. CPCC 205371]